MLISRAIDSPVGPLMLVVNNHGLKSIDFCSLADLEDENAPSHPALEKSIKQIDEYFAGTLKAFDLPLALQGSKFQLMVWNEVTKIPMGQTLSYSELAKKIGKPKAANEVKLSLNYNPIPIVIGCHRLLGKTGALIEYRGGLDIKKWLLIHEGHEDSF